VSGSLCYLGSIKIYPISLGLENGLDVVLFQYLTDSVVFFTYERMEKIFLQLQYSRNVALTMDQDTETTRANLLALLNRISVKASKA